MLFVDGVEKTIVKILWLLGRYFEIGQVLIFLLLRLPVPILIYSIRFSIDGGGEEVLDFRGPVGIAFLPFF